MGDPRPQVGALLLELQQAAARWPGDHSERLADVLAIGARVLGRALVVVARAPDGTPEQAEQGMWRVSHAFGAPESLQPGCEIRAPKALAYGVTSAVDCFGEESPASLRGLGGFVAAFEVAGAPPGVVLVAGGGPGDERLLDRAQVLVREIAILVRTSAAITSTVLAFNHATDARGDDLYRGLARHTAGMLGLPYAFVTECVRASRVRVRAFWKDGEFAPAPFEYDLAGTPCEAVLGGEICTYPTSIQALFPEDPDLVEFSSDSYVGVPILDRDGAAIGHIAALDRKPFVLTERQRVALSVLAVRASGSLHRASTEGELRKAEEWLDMARAAAPVGIWDTNLTTGEVRADENARAMSGLPHADEADPEVWRRGVHPDDVSDFNRRARDLLEGRTDQIDTEHRVVHPDGSVRWLACRGRMIEDEESGDVRVVVAGFDVTERKLAEERRRQFEKDLVESQRLESLGLMAGGVAHDFNNLLMVIEGNAAMLRARRRDGDPGEDRLASIELAAHRAAQLTHQMLTYSGRTQLETESLDMNKLIVEMSELLDSVISRKATLRLELADEIPNIVADGAQVRQIVMNLITNASDAIDGTGGTIRVKTGVVGGDVPRSFPDRVPATAMDASTYVLLDVHDDGCGMSAEVRARLFDPFYTTKFAGRGLGMSAVLGAVRAHGGAVHVHSEPGAGARVRVFLPASPGRAVPREEKTTGACSSARPGQRIVVVDDEAMVRELIGEMLSGEGYEVELVAGGAEAIRRLDSAGDRVDLILLDLTMPDVSGLDVVEALRGRPARPRVLLMSGFSAEHAAEKVRDLPVDGFLQKPIGAAGLLQAVANALGEV